MVVTEGGVVVVEPGEAVDVFPGGVVVDAGEVVPQVQAESRLALAGSMPTSTFSTLGEQDHNTINREQLTANRFLRQFITQWVRQVRLSGSQCKINTQSG